MDVYVLMSIVDGCIVLHRVLHTHGHMVVAVCNAGQHILCIHAARGMRTLGVVSCTRGLVAGWRAMLSSVEVS